MSFALPALKVRNLCKQPTGIRGVTSVDPNESKLAADDCEISSQTSTAFYVYACDENWSEFPRKTVSVSTRSSILADQT